MVKLNLWLPSTGKHRDGYLNKGRRTTIINFRYQFDPSGSVPEMPTPTDELGKFY